MIEDDSEVVDDDGYESLHEYWMDNQVEQSGQIIINVPPSYSGCVAVEMSSDSRVEIEILPSLNEACEVAGLAANPLSGGYKKIILSESLEQPTISSASQWLFGDD